QPRSLVRAMLLALTVGLGYEVAARSIPIERRGIAWSRLAPVRAHAWIAAKLAGTGLLSFAILAVAAVSTAFALGIGGRELARILCVVLPALLDRKSVV